MRRTTPPSSTSIRKIAIALAVASVFASAGVGCHVDITRVRDGNALDVPAFESLKTGETTLQESLDALGAPDRIEWKSGKDYLWYLHQDFTRIGLRFQTPISFLGYRHTVAELDTNSDETNSIALVFDETDRLVQKSLRLSQTYRALEGEESSGWAWSLQPRYAIAPTLIGDGGEADFSDLFEMGQLVGLDVGVQPIPFFVVLVGANYQLYPGDDFQLAGNRIELDDLELYQVHVGGRLQFPPEFFTRFWDVEAVKTLFYRSDVRAHQGPFFYIKWTLSGTYADSVKVEINDAPRGTYFDHSLSLSSTIGAGFEYTLGHFGAHIEFDYQTIGAFDEGTNRVLDTEASDFGSLLVGVGVSVRF